MFCSSVIVLAYQTRVDQISDGPSNYVFVEDLMMGDLRKIVGPC